MSGIKDMGSLNGARVHYFGQLSSTNDEARKPCYRHGDVIVADRQTAGRGQQGNHWESEPGMNLTFTIVLEPDFLPAGEQFDMLRAVSVAVAVTLEEMSLRAAIKWPNDIYIGDRKAAGLLIENTVSGYYISRTIVGIGLNVNQSRFSPSLPNPTSMALAAGREFDRAAVLESLHGRLLEWYDILRRCEPDSLWREYHARLYRLAAEHTYKTPDGNLFRGIIKGVAPAGELFVEHLPGREIRSYLFKEIEFL